jgi:hypothetical protein
MNESGTLTRKAILKTATRMKIKKAVFLALRTSGYCAAGFSISFLLFKAGYAESGRVFTVSVLFLILTAFAVLSGLLKKISLHHAALTADSIENLKDAFSSALYFMEKPDSQEPMMELAIQHADQKAANFAGEKKIRLFSSRDIMICLTGILLVIAALLLPVKENKLPALIEAVFPRSKIVAGKSQNVLLTYDDKKNLADLITELKKSFNDDDSKEVRDPVDRAAKITDNYVSGKISEQDFKRNFADIQNELKKQGEASEQTSNNEIMNKLAEKFKSEELTKNIGEQMEKGNVENAMKELEKLLSKDLKKEDLERLKNLFRDFLDDFKNYKFNLPGMNDKKGYSDDKLPDRMQNNRQISPQPPQHPDMKTQEQEKNSLENVMKQIENMTKNLDNPQTRKKLMDMAKEYMKNMQQTKTRGEKSKNASEKIKDLSDWLNMVTGTTSKRKQELEKFINEMKGKGESESSSSDKNAESKEEKEQDSYGSTPDEHVTGKETGLDSAAFRDEKITGKKDAKPSRKEIIQKAAEKGHAMPYFKDIVRDYSTIVTEDLEKEKVPQTRRLFIKRYFELIGR